MKTVCKKLFSLVLVAILLVSAVPFQAFADELTTARVTFTGNDGQAVYTIKVPVGSTIKATVDANSSYASYYGYLDNDALAGAPAGKTIAGWTINGTTYTLEQVVNLQITADNQATVVFKDATYVLTLDADGGVGGTINGTDRTTTRNVVHGSQVGTLPTPVAPSADYTFGGWYITVDGKYLEAGAYSNWTENVTAVAKWNAVEKNLLVKRVINSNLTGAQTIYSANVIQSSNLLDYLRENVTATVKDAVPAGYSWDGYWRDYRLNALSQQNDTMGTAQEVYVNFTANTYTLYFNAGEGGSVSPTSKSVTYDAAVGTLPTPTRDGDVFLGWFDENGVKYTKDTVYKVAGDTTLVAKWQDEAFVLLKIYVNGDTTAADRIVDMTGYVKDSNVTRADVQSIVTKHYSAKSGSSLSIAGLFTDATWAEYKKNSSYAGSPTVQITEGEPMYIYIMVSNAKDGGSSTGSTGSTSATNGTSSTTATKEADSTNPKTGDNSMIYVSMTVMVMAAAAVTALYLGRKKRMF